MVSTHRSHHILDLIITRSSRDITINEVQSTLFLSDHCFVECNLGILRPNITKKEVQFRNMRQINLNSFKSDIVKSNLSDTTMRNVDNLVKSYDNMLTRILDKHAPIQRKVIRERKKTTWFNGELRRLKKIKRGKLERKMRKSDCICVTKSYRMVCNEYFAKQNKAKQLYYSELIDKFAGDSRKVFKVVFPL